MLSTQNKSIRVRVRSRSEMICRRKRCQAGDPRDSLALIRVHRVCTGCLTPTLQPYKPCPYTTKVGDQKSEYPSYSLGQDQWLDSDCFVTGEKSRPNTVTITLFLPKRKRIFVYLSSYARIYANILRYTYTYAHTRIHPYTCSHNAHMHTHIYACTCVYTYKYTSHRYTYMHIYAYHTCN